MTAETKDEGSKQNITEGMSEAGKGVAPKGGTGPDKTPSAPDEMAKGMSKSGSGEATGGGGPTTKKR